MIEPLDAKSAVPRRPSCLDIETSSDGSLLDIGFFHETADGEARYETFTSWPDFLSYWEILYRAATKAHNVPHKRYLRKIYAHYGASFDWPHLVQYAQRNDLIKRADIVHSDSFCIGIDIRLSDAAKLQLRDSYRLLPASLDMLCQTFSVDNAKIDIPLDYKQEMERFKMDHPTEYYDYLRNDVLGLSQVLERLHAMLLELDPGIGELPMTLPSLAMRLFRRTLEKPIPVPMAESLKRLERRAYRGGRVECFVASTEYCMVDDVNSMYPFVMQSREYPESYVGTWTRTYRGKHGLYTGQFVQTARQYPAVLFDETKQDYAYDGSGTFAQPDIERLLEIGGSFTCEEGYEFMRMGRIFETFVNRWYGIRQEAKARNDEALSYVCKILMNSLYGKFGQKEEREATKILDGETIKSMVERGEGPTVYPNGVVVVKEKTYRQNGFVSVAAYVTAHARVELHRRMCEVIDQGYRVLYVDTDSVHHTGATLERSDALGSMKLEYQGIMTHIGRKLYATVDGDVKAKGVGKSAKPSYDEMVAMLDGWSKTIEFTVMPTWREIIIGGKDAAKPFLRKRTIRRTA